MACSHPLLEWDWEEWPRTTSSSRDGRKSPHGEHGSMDFQGEDSREVLRGSWMEELAPTMVGWNLLLDKFHALEQKLGGVYTDSQATCQMIEESPPHYEETLKGKHYMQ